MEQDSIVMYIVVREELNLSIGKACAQVGHGVQKCLEWYMNFWKDSEDEVPNRDMNVWSINYKIAEIYRLWMQNDYRKVVLRADDKEFEKLKVLEEKHFLIIDNGLTEIEKGTETVVCFMPMYKSQAPKLIKRLQLLK